MKLVLDAEGLAEALSLAVSTVRGYATTHPEKLPPRLNLPYNKPMYAVEDVQEWIRQHSPNFAAPSQKDVKPARPAATLDPRARKRLQNLGLLDDEERSKR